MGLYEEALRYKKMAENAIRRGDLDSAKRYIKLAITKLEILEKTTDNPTIRAIWEKAKRNLYMLLEGIESGAIKRKEQVSTPTETRSASAKTRGASRSSVSKTKKERRSLKKSDIPEVCQADFLLTSIPNITFKDVANLEDVKQELREGIQWQIIDEYREMLEKMGLRPIKGILLYGPPGTGKTFIVKSAAGEFKIPLIIVDPASLMSKWLGESEKMIARIFDCARQLAPSLVFIDEVDKVFPLTSSGSDAPKRIEAQLLQELDGVQSGEGFIVIFASNEPWNLNPALIRANRIDKVIYVGPPNDEMRRKLFELYLKGVDLAEDVDFDRLVFETRPTSEGYYSAAAIALICNEAKKNLLRYYEKTGKLRPLTMDDLLNAISSVRRDIPIHLIKRYEDWKKTYFTGG